MGALHCLIHGPNVSLTVATKKRPQPTIDCNLGTLYFRTLRLRPKSKRDKDQMTIHDRHKFERMPRSHGKMKDGGSSLMRASRIAVDTAWLR